MTEDDRKRIELNYSSDEQGYDDYRFKDPKGALQTAHDQWIFRKMFVATEDDRVLEVGSGTGRFTMIAATTGAHIVATDINENMLALLPDRVPQAARENRLEVRKEDVFKLSFEDNTFDFAFGIHIIPRFRNLRDQQQAIIEIGRALKPGGRLLFNFSNRSSLYGYFYKGHAASSAEIDSMLKEAGLVAVARRGKWLLTRSTLAKIPLACAKLAARIDRGLSRFVPSLAWDVFVLAEKRPLREK